VYKPSVKNIMDKYYEMFQDKNSPNKEDFFNKSQQSRPLGQDSDTDG
jgi:hypothetical protein